MTEEALTLGEPSAEAAALVLTYLGCEEATTAACPQAGDASPLLHVDPSDPPALLVTGSDELVPADQARAMADALANAGVGVDVIVEDGDAHGLALLTPATRERVVAFLVTELGA